MEKVSIIILECGGLDVIDERWKPFISPERGEKLLWIKSLSGRQLSLGAELALCAALNIRGLPCRPPEYYRGENGKPYLLSAPQHISLSHSGSLAVCAIADIPVGVDIETPRRVDRRIAKRILSPEEYRDDISSGELLRKWVVKESRLKLTGEGLAGSMSCFSALGGNILFGDKPDGYYELFESVSPEYLLGCCCREPFEAELETTDPETLFGLLLK